MNELQKFPDVEFNDDDDRCYEEVKIAAHEKLGKDAYGMILKYDCGCSSLFWLYLGEDKPNDYESYEHAIGENACPDCGHNHHEPEYAHREAPHQPIIAASPTAQAPPAHMVNIECPSGIISIDLSTENIKGSHAAIKEVIEHLNLDGSQAKRILLGIARHESPQIDLF